VYSYDELEPTFERGELPFMESTGNPFGEEEYRILSSDFKGYFSWARNATCDGVNREVITSTEDSILGNGFTGYDRSSSNYRSVIFTYPHALTIDHDPKLGFVEVSGVSIIRVPEVTGEVGRILNGDLIMFTGTAMVVATLVGLSWKRRGPDE